jgi:cellulase
MVSNTVSVCSARTDNIVGPAMIYMSPDPPTENSFVKIWHEGKFISNPFPQAGVWASTGDIAKNFGHMNMRIPDNLKPGQ